MILKIYIFIYFIFIFIKKIFFILRNKIKKLFKLFEKKNLK